MLYLSYKIMTNKLSAKSDGKILGFKEGIIMVALNPKAFTLFILMFTQFAAPDTDILIHVIILSVAITLIAMANDVLWATFGAYMGKFAKDEKAVDLQNKILGILLIATALFMAFS